MIDYQPEHAERILSEHTLSLSEAAKLVPSNRGNKPVHVSWVLRAVMRGAEVDNKGRGGAQRRRVRLEAVRAGGHWVTSREALARFLAAVTAQKTAAQAEPSRATDDPGLDGDRPSRVARRHHMDQDQV